MPANSTVTNGLIGRVLQLDPPGRQKRRVLALATLLARVETIARAVLFLLSPFSHLSFNHCH